MNKDLKKIIQNAIAIVRLEGLGFVCFNDEVKQLETLFIHAKEHNLSIRIFDPEVLEKVVGEHHFVNENDMGLHPQVKISIESISSETQELTAWETETFNRTKLNDANDIRWLIDLKESGLIPEDKEVTKSTNYAKSTISIQNCVVYTDKLTADPDNDDNILSYKKIFEKEGIGQLATKSKNVEDFIKNDLNPQECGMVANRIAAAVKGKAVKLVIEYNNKIYNYYLKKAKKPFIIVVENMPPDEVYSTSDMSIYREFWGNNLEWNADKFDLITTLELDKIGKRKSESVGVWRICNLATVKTVKKISEYIYGNKTAE